MQAVILFNTSSGVTETAAQCKVVIYKRLNLGSQRQVQRKELFYQRQSGVTETGN